MVKVVLCDLSDDAEASNWHFSVGKKGSRGECILFLQAFISYCSRAYAAC